MLERPTNPTYQSPPVQTRCPPVEARLFRPPVLVALLLGAIMGAIFGALAGGLHESGGTAGSLWPFGGVAGALLGLLAGVAFVLVGLLLYRFIHSALTGAIALGLFAALAMALVGGLFGALIGLLAGMILGALVGVVKAEGGLVVGDVAAPARSAPASSWWLPGLWPVAPGRSAGASVRTPPPPTPTGRETQRKSMLARRWQV
jgi:hypothetical protein